MSRMLGPLGPSIRLRLLLTLRQFPPVQGPIEKLQRSLRLIVRHLMTSLINPSEREIAILPCLAILDTINGERRIASLPELVTVLIFRRQGDCLPTKPITDVVCVSVDESHAHGSREDIFQIGEEIRPDEIAGLLEGEVDLVIGLGVVYVDA
jgi:hypothetical protein